MSKNTFLLISVFITGSAVLVIEILATRILAPYYGNTIYTTSSVIGVVLMALSLGYYVGGILADKYLEHVYFYLVIFISGCTVVFMQAFYTAVLPSLGVMFSISYGPLITSLLFFFTPAFLLGILSPFAVALYKKEQPNVGGRSGEVFFWSTLGSIFGSLVSGFFLIPYFGISVIILTTGFILMTLGLVGFWYFKRFGHNVILLICISLAFLLLAYVHFPKQDTMTLYERDGVYEKIKIVNGDWNGRPARFLFQDRSYSAAMYLDSKELAYDYTKYYALYQLVNPQASRALVIGGGAYSIPKALLDDSPNMQVVVSEIEPELFSLAKTYFNLNESPRLTNIIQDGRSLLRTRHDVYDVMVSDVYYSFFSIPINFTTREFFTLAKSRLSDNGVFIGNFAGDLNQEKPSFLFSEINTFKKVFPNSYFFAVRSSTSLTPQNIIFLGINGNKRLDFSDSVITDNTNPILAGIAQKNIDITNIPLSEYSEITDDYAPVEYEVSNIINHWN